MQLVWERFQEGSLSPKRIPEAAFHLSLGLVRFRFVFSRDHSRIKKHQPQRHPRSTCKPCSVLVPLRLAPSLCTQPPPRTRGRAARSGRLHSRSDCNRRLFPSPLPNDVCDPAYIPLSCCVSAWINCMLRICSLTPTVLQRVCSRRAASPYGEIVHSKQSVLADRAL